MTIEEIIFYICSTITVTAAVFLAFTRNIVHAAFTFLIVLLGVASLFVFAHAEYIAVAQILIYVGGVLVLIIFGVMLTAHYASQERKASIATYVMSGLFCTLILGCFLYAFSFLDLENAIYNQTKAPIPAIEIKMSQWIGYRLMTDMLLPFEATGILLMISLIGAAMIAGNFASKNKSTTR